MCLVIYSPRSDNVFTGDVVETCEAVVALFDFCDLAVPSHSFIRNADIHEHGESQLHSVIAP
eukprot:scaffold5867_cov81-Skeletonema_dohrnii-CCMP3373.AAC.2